MVSIFKKLAQFMMILMAPVTVAQASEQTVALPKQELNCLIEAVYFEARSEPLSGQIAVAEVIINRVESGRFPDSICGVVSQGEQRRNACQFSFRCDGKPEHMTEPAALGTAKNVSRRVLSDTYEPITDGALFYHADYVKPYWAKLMERTSTIGRHIFYRDL